MRWKFATPLMPKSCVFEH